MPNHEIDPCGLPHQSIAMALSDLAEGKAGFGLVTATLRGDGTAYVIKDDDFPLFQTAVTTLAGMAGGMAAFAPAAIASLIVLLVAFRKKHIQLTAPQVLIVRELQRSPGLTKEQLCALLTGTLEQSTVLAELEGLKSLANASGKLAEIIRTDSVGRWYLVDI